MVAALCMTVTLGVGAAQAVTERVGGTVPNSGTSVYHFNTWRWHAGGSASYNNDQLQTCGGYINIALRDSTDTVVTKWMSLKGTNQSFLNASNSPSIGAAWLAFNGQGIGACGGSGQSLTFSGLFTY